MVAIEFGIIEDMINEARDYVIPEREQCVSIADDVYIDDWWNQLCIMKTYFYGFDRPKLGLARYGVTLIPPESLPAFQEIVLSDRRINEDDHLVALAKMIQDAIDRKKFMIHFGV